MSLGERNSQKLKKDFHVRCDSSSEPSEINGDVGIFTTKESFSVHLTEFCGGKESSNGTRVQMNRWSPDGEK